MAKRPFVNVAWNQPFLPSLLDLALEETGGDPGEAFFVFPHARPALYLTELIRTDPRAAKPCIMPRMESVSGLFSLFRASFAQGQSTPVGILDQVALLLAAIRELRAERGGLLRDLPLDDSRRFFPWGVRLANVMEEFFIHNRIPEDYIYMQGEAAPFAAALLENLGALHARYLTALQKRGWTTPGLDAYLTAQHVARGPGPLSLAAIRGKRLILAGFHTLTGAQQVLFKRLWESHDALICLHADPKITDKAPHWSCTDLVRWASAWGASITPCSGDEANAGTKPEISFRAGYDVHSQLGDLAETLKKNQGKSATAIVLPDAGLLLPVLHHLPDMDVNISMGYPLARSPLFRLLESMLALRETRRGAGPYTYYWKNLIALIRHPYCKMLDPFAGREKATSLPENNFRRFLHHAERIARASRRFQPLERLAAQCAATFALEEGVPAAPELIDLFERILAAAVFQWEEIATPAALAAALENATDLLRVYGGKLWNHFPIDAECLYRLGQSIIPQLAHTALAEEKLPPETLFSILRQLLASERVPFEAYPLVGDQIMGVLETRLLHFDRIFVVDLTDDSLPGKSGHDPLFPDSLRALAGMPGAQGREKVAAYNFFRLIAGAREATLYWQEGVEAKGLNDAKKNRSRFVEELLWEEEKRLGRILAPENPENAGADGPLRRISCTLPPAPRHHKTIVAGDAARKRVQSILRGELSPSLIDAYLRCPAKFFYQRVGRIREVESVVEGRDPMGVGVFLHGVLQKYFAARLRTPIAAAASEFSAMRALFADELANSELSGTLPADDRIMLEEAGPGLLNTLLENHAGRIPLHVEEQFRTEMIVDGERRILVGVVDRVDEADGLLHVLDYKTGRIPLLDPTVWHDEAFWNAVENWTPGDGNELFDLAASFFGSVQLPAYMCLFSRHTGKNVHNAAYVPVKAGESDAFLLGDETAAADRTRIVEKNIPALLSFLLRHMAHATAFAPRPDQNCDWCLYKNLCIVALR